MKSGIKTGTGNQKGGTHLVLLIAGRMLGEEKMLIEELDGYNDYKKRVKYWLIPSIW